MLTRLRVSGFKNLVDVDVRFGPFTCIAGANGVGKSNLFDAIRFLSNLATHPLREAALMVRDEQSRAGDLRSLFTRMGDQYVNELSLEAEMIIPRSGEDDLGQPAEATITFLRYELVLGYEEESALNTVGRLVVRKELLAHINLSEAKNRLGFPHSSEWRKSVVLGRRTANFISTEDMFIKRHQEGPGHPQPYAANRLLRTVLCSVNAGEAATAALAKREMQSWLLLQLEPTALRRPDPVDAPSRLGADGAHLPATLYRLGRAHPDRVYLAIGNRLSELNEDVQNVLVDRDDKRDLLTAEVMDRSGTRHPARALSDGTLRFLALTVIEKDEQMGGVLCLEEPENGIHPARIAAMLNLLRDIVSDPNAPMEPDEKLRQVIINTHSPAVVTYLPADTLMVAERTTTRDAAGRRSNHVKFSAVEGTWRTEPLVKMPAVRIGKLLAYLEPDTNSNDDTERDMPKVSRRERTVRDLYNKQLSLFHAEDQQL